MEQNSEGFPSDAQRAAFKDALAKIEADAKNKGIPIPTEKGDLTITKDAAAPPADAPKAEEKKAEEKK
jgi:hypothetical protein